MYCNRCGQPKRRKFLWWIDPLECSNPKCLGLYSDAGDGVASALFFESPELVKMSRLANIRSWLLLLQGALSVSVAFVVGMTMTIQVPILFAVLSYLAAVSWLAVILSCGVLVVLMLRFAGKRFPDSPLAGMSLGMVILFFVVLRTFVKCLI